MRKIGAFAGVLIGLIALTASGGVQAEWHRDGHWRRPYWHDRMYRHDFFYPDLGFYFSTLPMGSIGLGYGVDRYFDDGGVWMRPFGPRYMVVMPPAGAVVPALPGNCVPLWAGGVPYYYANGVYYAAAPGQGYMVVNPPPGVTVDQPARPVDPEPVVKELPAPIFHPRNGQGALQTQADRQACMHWASTQKDAQVPDVFRRGLSDCMDARGYTVR